MRKKFSVSSVIIFLIFSIYLSIARIILTIPIKLFYYIRGHQQMGILEAAMTGEILCLWLDTQVWATLQSHELDYLLLAT